MLSVIIPCYNAADTLTDQLDAFLSQYSDKAWELIVADNGSTDNTLQIVEKYCEQLANMEIIDASEIRGAGFARNKGAKAARGDLLAFVDADDQVGSGWIDVIFNALQKHDFVASRFEHQKLSTSILSKKRGGPQRNGLQPYTYPSYYPHSGGSGLAVKRWLHEKVGGFDESLPRLQDTDYCWRIQLQGTQLYFEEAAVVHVRPKESLSEMYRQSYVWGEYNVLMYKKYEKFGMPRLSFGDVTSSIIYWLYDLVRNILRVRNRSDFAPVIAKVGNRLGRFKGSLKYRVLAI